MGGPRGVDDQSSPAVDASIPPLERRGDDTVPGGTPPSEVFQMLADETRIRILLALFDAEHRDTTPVPFADLQAAVGAEESARFAYHVRQLVDHFVAKDETGYALTPSGRQAVTTIRQGSLGTGPDWHRAS